MRTKSQKNKVKPKPINNRKFTTADKNDLL